MITRGESPPATRRRLRVALGRIRHHVAFERVRHGIRASLVEEHARQRIGHHAHTATAHVLETADAYDATAQGKRDAAAALRADDDLAVDEEWRTDEAHCELLGVDQRLSQPLANTRESESATVCPR